MGTVINPESNGVGGLLHRITDDVKTIALDELELAKNELAHVARTAAAESAIIVLGGIVALIGFGMLCASAVAGLEGLIHPLWARLLVMAVVYLVAGGIIAGIFAKRLQKDIKPDLAIPAHEARSTITGIKSALDHS
jgi:hypothetical protein